MCDPVYDKEGLRQNPTMAHPEQNSDDGVAMCKQLAIAIARQLHKGHTRINTKDSSVGALHMGLAPQKLPRPDPLVRSLHWH